MSYSHTALYQQIQVAEEQLIRYRRIEEDAFFHSVQSGLPSETTPDFKRRRSLRHQLASAIRHYHEFILRKRWFSATAEQQDILENAAKLSLFEGYRRLSEAEKKQELARIKENIQFYGDKMVVTHQKIHQLGGTNHGSTQRTDTQAIRTGQDSIRHGAT